MLSADQVNGIHTFQARTTQKAASQTSHMAVALSTGTTLGLVWFIAFFMMLSDNTTFLSVMSWIFSIVASLQVQKTLPKSCKQCQINQMAVSITPLFLLRRAYSSSVSRACARVTSGIRGGHTLATSYIRGPGTRWRHKAAVLTRRTQDVVQPLALPPYKANE